MGSPSYMQSVVDQNVVMRRMAVFKHIFVTLNEHSTDSAED